VQKPWNNTDRDGLEAAGRLLEHVEITYIVILTVMVMVMVVVIVLVMVMW
jgi:hypothetical protein